MATIPIEIVLQDPNNPIVPDTPGDDPGENTNILVPDTSTGAGYTTKDGNSTNSIFGGSNATVSIVSIVVLVLTLGTIIVLLIRRYQKQRRAKESTDINANSNAKEYTKLSKKEKLATAVSSTIAILTATVLVGNICMTVTNAATDNTSNDGTTLTTPDKIQIIANRHEDVTIVASTKAVSYATTDTSFGYKIFMSMAGEDANLYLDGDTDSEYYFAPTTKLGLSTNSWGYSLDGEEEYYAMPGLENALMAQQNTEAVTDDEFTVYYTMKADKDMPFGVYSGEIAYDIEGYNGFPSTLTSMQQMTSEICDAVYTPNAFRADGVTIEDNVPTATLTDIRDNKTYTIAKLADGKCWMTQNLDLDLSADIVLTPADTDVSQNWTPERNTIRFTGTSVNEWIKSRTTPDSADPGELYIYSSNTTGIDEQYTSLEGCKEAHSDCDRRNHVGNYYNWPAAIAYNDTSGITEPFTNVETSICPAGWKLPTGRQSNTDSLEGNEIGSLLNYYDILGSSSSCGGACTTYDFATQGLNIIRNNPLRMVRSGYIVTYNTSVLETMRSYGYYWTSTFGQYNAYGIYFSGNGSNAITPAMASGNNRDGYTIRCIAQ